MLGPFGWVKLRLEALRNDHLFWANFITTFSRRAKSPQMVVKSKEEVSPKCPKHSGLGIIGKFAQECMKSQRFVLGNVGG